MKLSASIFYTDILPHKRKLYNQIIKNKIFSNHSSTDVFATLKKAGFDGIELLLSQFITVTDADLLEIKDLLTSHNMPVLSVHQQLRLLTKTRLPEIAELFKTAATLGAKVIVLHMNSAGKQVFDKEYVNAVHALQKKYGIQVGYENMEKFAARLHLGHIWHEDKFAELMQENDFGITLDTTHLAHSDGDILTFFKKNKERIVNIHLSDYKPHIFNGSIRPFRYKHLPLGEGILPIEKFIQLLQKENYSGLVTMEIHTDLAGMCESAGKVTAALTRKQND